MKKAYIIICAALFLSACAESPPPPTLPDLTFANVNPIPLNVARIEVTDAYRPPMRSPNIEHLFRVPPADAVKNLLNRALAAAGSEKTLRVEIEDASVIDEKLPVAHGFIGAFSREPSDRYNAKVFLRFELVDPAAPDIVIGHAEVVAHRSHSILNGDSPAERDHAEFELTEALMKDVSDSLNGVVKDTFGKR
jgi:hypothetical protein